MKFSNLMTKTKVLIGISTPLALGLAIGGISGFSIDSIVESNKWVDHTRVVLADAAGIVGSAVDMETGMRGYLLAGEEGFLDPYSNGERATYSRIDALREIVNDNPAQVERLNQAERVLREWQEIVTEPTIALRREIGDAETMNDMADLVGEARGKVYFDKFREQITTFIARETTLLEARRAEFTAAQGQVDGNLELMQNTVGWIDHTNGVLAAAAQILAHAVDMETGMRGYLLAGEEEFLAPYNDGKQSFFAGVEALQRTVNDNPAAVARLGKARDLIQQWVNEVTEPAIALRRQVNDGVRSMDAVDAYVSRKAGKKFFDAFRAEIAAFSEAEIDLLAERKAATEAAEATMHADLATMKTNEEWVAHTYTVIRQADAILAAAVDMETGMRGYLLAGQDSFLEPYNAGAQSFFDLIASLRDTVNDNPAQVQLLTAAEQTIRDWQKNVTEPTIALRGQIGDAKNMDDMADLVGEARGKQYFDKFRQIMTDFAAVETGLMDTRKADNEATVSTTFILIAVFSVAALVIGLLLAWLIGNAIARPMRKMTDSVGALAGGAQDIELPNLEGKDEIGEMARSLLQIKEMGERAARAQAALTSASSPMMLVSGEGEVIFANQEMNRLFDALAKNLAAELSGFAGREVVGARFDTLHNIREMSTQSLATISGQCKARMEIAGHTLDLAAGPVINEQGDRLGTVVEWSNMTQQVAIEQEVAGLVDAAAAGDFTRRIEEAGKEGFMLELSKGMNQVVGTVDNGLSETVEVMAAMADGDLTKRMVGDYQGSFLKLKEDANRMAEQIG
ncbi:MAG: CHASE3 domain-containing protein, partial [Thermohalobaculum sp.]